LLTKTNDKDEEGIHDGNAMMQQKLTGLPSVCNIDAALLTKKTNYKNVEGNNEDSDDNSGSSSSKTSSSSSSDTESSNSNNGILADDNTVSTTNFPI